MQCWASRGSVQLKGCVQNLTFDSLGPRLTWRGGASALHHGLAGFLALDALLVAAPVDRGDRGQALELHVALAEVPRLHFELQPQGRRLQVVRVNVVVRPS